MLDDFREWLSDNLRYILLGLAILLVLVIAFCIVRLVGGRSSREPSQDQTPVQVEQQTERREKETEAGDDKEDGTQAAVDVPQSRSDLFKDDSAVLTLTREYYTAVAAEDTATLSSIVDPWDAQVQAATLSGTEIESYNNIKTYSKQGVDDQSFVVFAYFEAKVPNVDTLAPTLTVLYMKTNEEGKLTVFPFKVHEDSAVSDYIAKVKTDSDVQALIADVQTAYDEAVASDEQLDAYVNTASGDDGQSSEQGDGQEQDGSDVSGTQMTAAYGLNVRSEANANASIVASLSVGTVVTVVGQTSDGTNTWYQVSVDLGNGTTAEGYIRSDLLTAGG